LSDVTGSVTALRPIGFTVKVAVLLTPLNAAVIVTIVGTETRDVVRVNAGEVDWPSGTVTKVGTPTAVSLLESAMVIPPAGALPIKVTVLLATLLDPITDAVETATADSAGGVTVRTACWDMPL